MTATSPSKAVPVDAVSVTPAADAQAQAARLFTRANELMIGMARSLWESQSELLQFEAEQATRAFVPGRAGGDPGETLAVYGQQWRDNSERLLAHMRRVNDLVRDCGWQMLGMCVDGVRETAKPMQDALRPGA